MAKKTPLAKLRMLYARSLGCTWVYHILCSQKNKSCGSSYPLIWDVSKMVPADPRFDERGFFIQRINKDFSQFSQKKHTSTSRLLHFFVPKPIKTPMAPALFRFASPHQLPRHQLQRPPLQQLQRRAPAAVDPSQTVDAAVERLGCTMVPWSPWIWMKLLGFGENLEDFSELMLIFMGNLED